LRFQQRRVPFFRRLLDRPEIFMTPPIHTRFEEAARQNLAQALAAAGAST
jgi:predicted metal-dependent HD superfamily phosphohydrolase